MMLDAEAVAGGQAAPQFVRADYERAMLELAASVGGDPIVAYAGLLAGRDPRMAALYAAARVADVLEGVAEDPSQAEALLARLIQARRLDGESTRDVTDRLIEADEVRPRRTRALRARGN